MGDIPLQDSGSAVALTAPSPGITYTWDPQSSPALLQSAHQLSPLVLRDGGGQCHTYLTIGRRESLHCQHCTASFLLLDMSKDAPLTPRDRSSILCDACDGLEDMTANY